MKARWLLITMLLAFPFAFAFFLREARLGEKPPAKPALVVAPRMAPSPAMTAVESPAPTPAESATTALPQTPPPIENPRSKIPNPPVALLTGTFTREDGSFIYDADAKLRLAKDVILSSPTGVMVSNEKQTLFAGDMQIESGKNTITAHEGVLDTAANQMKATVASISFTNENNQLVRMTGENVTLELPTSEKSPASSTVLADSVTVESAPTPPSSATAKP
jgi:hypothetical protein